MEKTRTASRDLHEVFQRVFLSLSVPYVTYSQILYNFLNKDILIFESSKASYLSSLFNLLSQL
jgi:hypothetical protein